MVSDPGQKSQGSIPGVSIDIWCGLLNYEVALRKASGRLTVTTITGSVRDTNPS